MNLAAFSIKQKVLVNLITIAALIIGVITVMKMQREAMPSVEVDYVFVTTVYPGASPQEVEKLITIPIEDAIDTIDGLDTYSSGSRESVSFIFIELEPDLPNRDRVINEIAREVDKVDLPDDAENPEVKEFVIEHALIEISFTGKGVPEKELRSYVDNFEDILKNIKDIGSINKVGYRDMEISIEVDPLNLENYYISLAQVIQSIRNQNVSLPGGKIKTGSKEIIIRTVGEIKTAREFNEIIIRTNSDGKYLRVGDVAEVKERFEEQQTIYKTDGKVSINIVPKKKKSGDIIRVVEKIKKEAEEFKKGLPENVSIDYLNDMSFYVKRRLNALIANGRIGLLLLIITLLVFLNARIALVTAIGIPFAFLTALIFMSFFNVSLNLLTMFGLILVLGMIVDDAIVVSENIYRYLEEGMPIKDAVIIGASEVAAPVTATILTSIAAFLPLMFISGIMGKFLRFFPMGVIFCLIASLFEALIILPSHLFEWAKPLKTRDQLGLNNTAEKTSKSIIFRIIFFPVNAFKVIGHYLFSHERKGSEAVWFQNLLGGYTKLLNFSIKRRYRMCFGALMVLVGSVIFSIKVMPFKLFPDIIEVFCVRIETPEGTSLEGTDKPLSAIEEIILQLSDEELENVTSTVGFSGEAMGSSPFDKYGTQYGQCVVYLTPATSRKRNADTIIAELKEKIEERNILGIINLEFEKIQGGPPVGKPVSIEIKGDEYDVLLKIVSKMKDFMHTLEGVIGIKDNYELDKEEVRVTIDKKEAARLGLNVRQIASTIRFAFEGGIATTMRKGREEIEVIVRLPEKYRSDLNTLKNITIPNDSGRLIRLNKVAQFTKSQGIKSISRKEGKRTVTVTASINENKTTAIAANKKIIGKFKDISREYPGYFFKGGGEWEDTTESIQSLFRAFAIAFMLIYIILATQFRSFIQPLIIMVSVPFGMVGVIFALFFHGQPLSMMAMFGMIGLTGVVVNDALIFVDFINKRREQHTDILQAVIDAGRTRLRPILLTSITTIIALMPLIYGIGGEEPFLVPSAISMAYGLLAATFLTLVIVPCVYLITNDVSRLLSRQKP